MKHETKLKHFTKQCATRMQLKSFSNRTANVHGDAEEHARLTYLVCIQGGPKSKPLPNDQKIVLNCIRACQWD